MWQEKVRILIHSRNTLILSSGVIVNIIVATSGYFLGSKITRKKLEAQFSEELETSKLYFRNLYENRYAAPVIEMKEDLDELAAKYYDNESTELDALEIKYSDVNGNIIEDRGYVSFEQLEDNATPVSEMQNIFMRHSKPSDNDELVDEWDYEAEYHVREVDTAEIPYVIHRDEFTENPAEYDQACLTYYAGDSVLVDEKDAPISDVEGLVKRANLRKFGHGSDDPNIVYIRNDRIGLDVEVVLSQGKYSVEVLGILEHSDYSGPMRKHNRDQKHELPRKFRADD